jgi:serine phosphatase RsbU (regulator of sigma subunit)
MTSHQRAIADSVLVAVCGYLIAGTLEATIIRTLQPTEWELAWVSDALLATALGIAVYLWRHLLSTRLELAERDRAELVLQTQLSVAAEIQKRLLPDVPPNDFGFEWAAALRSAGQIGGDFYDFVKVASGVWTVLVADVSGKGIPAAMSLGSLRSTFRTFAKQSFEPARIVSQLSTVLYDEWRGSPYVTCLVLRFDLKVRAITYTNAGHPPGIVVGLDGIRYLRSGGPPAGLLPKARFEQEQLHLREGDACLLVTDGVIEALEDGEPIERDLEKLQKRRDFGSAEDLCATVMTRALSGHGPPGVDNWDDDRTVVVVKVSGRVTPAHAAGRAAVSRGSAA